MKVNLSSYDYSYANHLGIALKNPLVKLIRGRQVGILKDKNKLIIVISKVFYSYISGPICIIPITISYLIGKAICSFSQTQVNLDQLHVVPPPIDILLAEGEEEKELEQEEIIDLVFRTEDIVASDDDKNAFKNMCERVANSDQWTNGIDSLERKEKVEMFYKQLSILLRGIVKKINSEEVSKDKQEDILKELVTASTRCHPTWLETSMRLYDDLYNQNEAVEIKLLRFVQQYKNDLILSRYQKHGRQWHVLSTIKRVLGDELGLDKMSAELDGYSAHDILAKHKGLTKWLFLREYEDVNQFVQAIQTKINTQGYDVSYAEYLLKLVEKEGIEDAADCVDTHFYTENYQLNTRAVNLLLKSIGILK